MNYIDNLNAKHIKRLKDCKLTIRLWACNHNINVNGSTQYIYKWSEDVKYPTELHSYMDNRQKLNDLSQKLHIDSDENRTLLCFDRWRLFIFVLSRPIISTIIDDMQVSDVKFSAVIFIVNELLYLEFETAK